MELQFGNYFSAFSGALYFAHIAKLEHEEKKTLFESEMRSYLSAGSQIQMNEHYSNAQAAFDDLNNAKKQREYLIYIALGVYATQMIDVWLFGGGKEPDANENASSSRYEFQPTYTYYGCNNSFGIKVVFPLGLFE